MVVTRSQKAWNEDAVRVGDGWMVVLDGATSLTGDTGLGTFEFVNAVADRIAEHGLKPESIRSQIAAAIRSAQDGRHGRGVTATIAAAAWDEHVVTTALLGDSLILLRAHDPEEDDVVVEDPAFVGREATLLTPVIDALQEGAHPDDAYRLALPELRRAREVRNTDNGVWVVSDRHDPADIAEHLHISTYPPYRIDSIMALTDGARRAIDFGLRTPRTLFDDAEHGRLGELLDLVDRVEQADPSRIGFPRFSYRDDATIAYSEV